MEGSGKVGLLLRDEKEVILGKTIEIILKRWAGPLLFCVLAWSVWHQLRSQSDLAGQLHRMRALLSGPGALTFLAAVALVIPNWGIEALKWRLLMKGLADMPFGVAVRAVLAGVAFSLNTPKPYR